jgi:hypothetical protein
LSWAEALIEIVSAATRRTRRDRDIVLGRECRTDFTISPV